MGQEEMRVSSEEEEGRTESRKREEREIDQGVKRSLEGMRELRGCRREKIGR